MTAWLRSRCSSKILILEFRAALLERELSPSTINVKLSAIRKLVDEARRAGMIGAEGQAPDHLQNLRGVPLSGGSPCIVRLNALGA